METDMKKIICTPLLNPREERSFTTRSNPREEREYARPQRLLSSSSSRVVVSLNDVRYMLQHPREEKPPAQATFEEVTTDELSLLETFDMSTTSMRKFFDHFDQNGDGIVSYEQFREGLKAEGIECPDDTSFAELIRQVDTDSSGGISFDEFTATARTLRMNKLFEDNTLAAPDSALISVYDYSPNRRRYVAPVRDTKTFFCVDPPIPQWASVRWIDVRNPTLLTLQRLAVRYRLHPLSVEDCLSDERPKVERFEHHWLIQFPVPAFLVPRRPSGEGEETGEDLEARLGSSQISIFLVDSNVMITVSCHNADIWNSVHGRLERPYSKLRRNGGHFLVYAVMDELTDQIQPIVQNFARTVRDMEVRIQTGGSLNDSEIYACKRQMGFTRRTIWPLQGLLQHCIQHDEFDRSVTTYLTDVKDHVSQLCHDLDSLIFDTKELQSEVKIEAGNKLNSTMYLLTLITTLFLPAQFLTGVYGMNFVSMPELEWGLGYLFFWALCIVSTALFVFFFRRYYTEKVE